MGASLINRTSCDETLAPTASRDRVSPVRRRSRVPWRHVGAFCLLLTPWHAASASAGGRDARGHGQLAFEANRGQAAPQVKFLARGEDYTVFLTAGEAVLRLGDRSPQRGAIRITPIGSRTEASIIPEVPLAGIATYSRLGATDVSVAAPTYAKVRYADLYPGVDLVYYGRARQLEYDFVVAPGADAGQIALSFGGAERLEVDVSGDLVLHTVAGELRQPRPVVYQDIDGARHHVSGDYVVDADGHVRFRLGAYDASRALVIDPLLSYSTYLGGSNEEFDYDYGAVFGIAVDGDGNAYVTGTTRSADFPTTAGADQTLGGEQDVFVTKFSPTGAVVYSTYLGGPCDDVARSIAVDGAGNAYITGRANGGICPSDVTPGVLVAKLSPTGAVIYSVVFGGSIADTSIGQGIAVDGAGNAYVTGLADSNSRDFPTTPGALRTEPCPYIYSWEAADGFVTKINAAGTDFVYSTYLCGSAHESPNGIAIDAAGHAYVVGSTASSDFPTVNPLQAAPASSDSVTGFVSKFSPDGSHLIYSTYFGGSGGDVIEGIAVDARGQVYVTGETSSSDFPTTAGALQEHPGDRIYCIISHGCIDAFVAKIDASGSSLVYSTYLYGESADSGIRIAVDSAGNAYVVGTTDSEYFPILDAFQPIKGGLYDGFIAKLNPDGTRLVYSSYLGGTHSYASPIVGWDGAGAVAVDTAGNAYIAGYTQSDDFPTTSGAFQPTPGGGICDLFGTMCRDGFVTKIAAAGPGVLPPVSVVVTPAQTTPGGAIGATWAGLPAPTSSDELRLYTLGGLAGPGDQLASWSTGAAAAGTLSLTLPAGLAAGTYEVRLLTPDPNAFGALTVVARSQPVRVSAAAPDVVVLAVSDPPTTAIPGDAFAVTDTVQNQGTGAAAQSTTRYYLSVDTAKDSSDILLSGSRGLAALNPGDQSSGTSTVSIPSTTSPGTYRLLACADDTGVVPETDESNNCLAAGGSIVVAGRPDLAQVSVTNPPTAAGPGAAFSVTDTVSNQGTLTAGASITRYYLSTAGQKAVGDILLTGSRSVPSLAPGASSTKTVSVSIPASAPFGTYFLLACADDSAVVAESVETNNCRASAGVIAVALPDLVQQSVSSATGSVRRGKLLTVSDTVENDALVATPRSTTTRYYLSSDGVRNSGDKLLTGTRTVPILGPAAKSSKSVSVRIPTTTSPGTYFLLACADDGKVVTEQNEANNCRASDTMVVVSP